MRSLTAPPRGARAAIAGAGLLLAACVTRGEQLLEPAISGAPPSTSAPATPASATPPAPPQPSIESCGPDRVTTVIAFQVEVEDGLGITRDDLAADLRDIYCDARGWLASGALRFQYYPDARSSGGYLIRLLSREGVKRECEELLGEPVSGNYSCAGSADRLVILNSERWAEAVPHWTGDLESYRTMVANHEMGHALTLRHVACPADGTPSPVMMQQSIGLTQGGRTCVENPWPLESELDRIRAAWG